jgi:hypothetical protein
MISIKSEKIQPRLWKFKPRHILTPYSSKVHINITPLIFPTFSVTSSPLGPNILFPILLY